MSILVWIIGGLVALIVILCWVFQGVINALRNERDDLKSLTEDKETRLQNIVEFKFPQEYREGEVWKVVVTGDKYQLDIYKFGRPWESYIESNAEDFLNIIKNLMGK